MFSFPLRTPRLAAMTQFKLEIPNSFLRQRFGSSTKWDCQQSTNFHILIETPRLEALEAFEKLQLWKLKTISFKLARLGKLPQASSRCRRVNMHERQGGAIGILNVFIFYFRFSLHATSLSEILPGSWAWFSIYTEWHDHHRYIKARKKN